MTRARVIRALGVTLALAAPSAPHAVDVEGALELNYQRFGTDSAAGRIDVPSWDFGGQFAVANLPVNPRVLQLSARGEYRQYHNLYLQTGSRMDNLGYGATVVALAGGPVTLSLGATRTQADFSRAATVGVGATATTAESATIALRSERLPTLLATVARTDVVNDTFDRGRVRHGTTGLILNASGGFGRHGYGLLYDTSWNDGSLAETNYRSHRVELHGRTELGEDVELRLDQHYFLRDPTVVDPASPRVDDVSVAAGATWGRSGPIVGGARYGYRHAVVDVPGQPARESLSNDAAANVEWRRSASLAVLGNVGVVHAVQRGGGVETSGASESAGAGVRWTGNFGRLRAMLGGSLAAGALQVSGGGGAPAWGATVGGSLSRSTARWYATAAYNGNVSANLGGVEARSQSHQLNASVDAALAPGWRLTGTLLGSAVLRDDVLLGPTRNRSAQASIGTGWRRHALQLTGQLSDGVSPTLGIAPGGPPLPSSLDTSSRTVSATAHVGVLPRLSVSASARYTTTVSPGVPERWERGASAHAAYGVGAFTFSLEDVWSEGGSTSTVTAPAVRRSGNVLLFRVVRSFGARY